MSKVLGLLLLANIVCTCYLLHVLGRLRSDVNAVKESLAGVTTAVSDTWTLVSGSLAQRVALAGRHGKGALEWGKDKIGSLWKKEE